MSSAGKIRRQSLRPICYIDMTAFLSFQVALLFLWMAAVVNYPDLPTNVATLPKVNHPVPMRAANREDAVMIVVQRDGRMWLGPEKVSPERLPAAIRESLMHGAEKKAYIRADARARYGLMNDVLDAVRSAGVEKIGFLVEQKKPWLMAVADSCFSQPTGRPIRNTVFPNSNLGSYNALCLSPQPIGY